MVKLIVTHLLCVMAGAFTSISAYAVCKAAGDADRSQEEFESLRMELADFGDEVIRQGHQAGLEMPNMVTRHALRILEIMGR